MWKKVGEANMIMMKIILKEIRIKQYTKNFLVFAAPVFAGMLFEKGVFIYILMTFLSFSFMASAVYILNDIMDREKDRKHPVKRYRPIAAGLISLPLACLMFLLLLTVSIGIAVFIKPTLAWLLIIYLLMNICYSMKFKYVVIIDVMIIAAGFVMRAYAGVLALDLVASEWFTLCIFMLSMFLALAKRRAELILFVSAPSRRRKVLQDYSLELLNQMLSIVTAVSLTSYSLFALQADQSHNGISMMITIPFVVYGMMRYLYLIYIKGQGDNPEDVLLHDKGIFLTCVLFSFIVIFLRDL